MFIRVVTVAAKNRTYRYTQLVESHRRESDGRPVHRVVTNLGELPLLLTENLRRAFAAARQGRSVVVPAQAASLPTVRPIASLGWLDIAVLLHVWRVLGLDALFARLLPPGLQTVAPGDVVAALVIHRCVDPDSKLAATAWFGRTALPEVLGFAPGRFTNTRLHRVLGALDGVTLDLQSDLPERLTERDGPLSAMFLDLSDTWFVGRGPVKAEERRTKEGLWRRKIAILLLCDARGRPLRWAVLPGRTHDAVAMVDVARDVQGCAWATGVPLVCDRIMGVPTRLAQLTAAGLHFVTALSNVTIAGQLGDHLPKIDVAGVDLDQDEAEVQVAACAARVGLTALRTRSWARDLGVLSLGVREQRPSERVSDHADTVRRARAYREARVQGQPRAKALTTARVALGSLARVLKLLTMHHEVLAAIERGDADVLAFETLQRLARLPVSDQPASFTEACAQVKRPQEPTDDAGGNAQEEDRRLPDTVRARLILCFHPGFFLRQRREAIEGWTATTSFIADLNGRLATPQSRRTEGSIVREVGRMLHRHHVAEVAQIHIDTVDGVDGRRYQVSVARDADAWDRQRALDGFRVLASHPDLVRTPEQIADLYADKQAVELDFRTIKSSLEIRPVYHRKDPKVSAHVTLCMLALLLLREIERLVPKVSSATALLHLLETAQLVRLRLAPAAAPSYALTESHPDVKEALRALHAEHLLDDAWVGSHITPR